MRRPVTCAYTCLAGICLTVTSGCYHMYSQPYGYNGIPSNATYPGSMQYQAPIQTLTPGQPYVPGSTVPGSSYQAYPQGTTPTYQSPGGGLQPIPETNNNAPTYNNVPPAKNPATPDPYFPGASVTPSNQGLYSIQPAAHHEPAALPPPSVGLREVRSVAADSVPQMNSAPALAQEPARVEEQVFAPPVMSPPPARSGDPFGAAPVPAVNAVPAALPAIDNPPAAASSLWDVETRKIATQDNSVFGHDSTFRWLRGVVSKDANENTWSIVYSDKPGNEERFSGQLSMAPSPHLDNLKDGDVVEVQGQIDGVVQDKLGKPVYVVSALRKPFAGTN